MNQKQTKMYFQGISEMKFLLILGVVLIHSNVSLFSQPNSVTTNFGIYITNFISSIVCGVCVPCFFFISAVLFFNGVKHFSLNTYIAKLKRRANSLLMPYMIWCTIYALILYVKFRFFHMPGLDIFLSDGSVNWLNFIQGYWGIPSASGWPYGFGFWFIRNLIVFVIISPIAWYIGRNFWLSLLFWGIYLCLDISLYGFEWFIAGTFYVTHYGNKAIKNSGPYIIIASILFWGGSILSAVFNLGQLSAILFIIRVLSALYLTYICAMKLKHSVQTNKFTQSLISSTFIIYAVHQCCCSKMCIFWINFWGYSNVISPIMAQVCTLVCLFAISYSAYLLLHTFTPRVLPIITGGR